MLISKLILILIIELRLSNDFQAELNVDCRAKVSVDFQAKLNIDCRAKVSVDFQADRFVNLQKHF